MIKIADDCEVNEVTLCDPSPDEEIERTPPTRDGDTGGRVDTVRYSLRNTVYPQPIIVLTI